MRFLLQAERRRHLEIDIEEQVREASVLMYPSP